MVFMMTCAIAAPAQTPTANNQQPVITVQQSKNSLPVATVKERLPDGGYIVTIGDTDFRAITRDLADSIVRTNRELDKTSEDLSKAKRVRVELEKQIALYKDNLTAMMQIVQIADSQRAEETGIAGNYKTLYLGEHDLRLKAEKLYAPPGKVTSFFQKPVVQLAEKLGKPIIENWLASRRQTTVVMTGDQLALLQSQAWNGLRPYVVLRQ
jgi:hypothetical protein